MDVRFCFNVVLWSWIARKWCAAMQAKFQYEKYLELLFRTWDPYFWGAGDVRPNSLNTLKSGPACSVQLSLLPSAGGQVIVVAYLMWATTLSKSQLQLTGSVVGPPAAVKCRCICPSSRSEANSAVVSALQNVSQYH